MGSKPKDITGQQFALLKAIRFVRQEGKEHIWLFQCACGEQVERKKRSVTSRATKSCGCAVNKIQEAENRYENLNSILDGTYVSMEERARRSEENKKNPNPRRFNAPATFEYRGKAYTLKELSAISPHSLSPSTLSDRIRKYGWSIERAVNAPRKSNLKRNAAEQFRETKVVRYA